MLFLILRNRPSIFIDQNFNKKLITNALVTSTKNAATKGKIIKAIGAGPCALVTAVMLAIAVGVAPNAKPPKPALNTAA